MQHRSTRPAPGSLLAAIGLLSTLGVGCAGDFGQSYRRAHPDFEPAPLVVGTPFGASVAPLYLDPGPDASVDVTELRVLQLDVEPWTAISLSEAEQRSGRIGVVAGRSCRIREGWLIREEAGASWFVFVDGALRAFGHDRFDSRCQKSLAFHPAQTELIPAERGLVRYVGQRYPLVRPSPLELAAQGFAYLEVGRLPETRHALRQLDRTIDRLKIERDTDYLRSDEELAELEDLEKALRAERAKLRRALKAAEKTAEATPES